MYLSVVTTMYYSAPYIQEFYTRISKSAKEITDDYEIIIVNDGSPDESLDIAVKICYSDSKVKVIDLSRNFGHHRAMMTGLRCAKGEKVFLIDCDLEEEPELLNLFYSIYVSNGSCDVVYGVQEKRQGSWFRRLSGEIYYWVLRNITGIDFPKNILTARLMSRRYVRSLVKHQERELVMAGLLHITGYTQIPVPVKKYSKGKTTYSIRKRIRMFINGIVSFTDRPLIVIFYTGLAICMISSSCITYLLICKIFLKISLEGWTSLMVSIWFLGGLIILFLGVIGIYISKIFIETKQRPYTIVKDIYPKGG